LEGVKNCFQKCRDFKCTKQALKFSSKKAWCNWTNEPCDIKSCNYALCGRRQLLENGVCSFSIKRKTREETPPEKYLDKEIRIKGKLQRKIGERTIF